MVFNKHSIETKKDDWSVPLWIKVSVTFFTCSAGAGFVLSAFSSQKTLLDISTELLAAISLGIFLLSASVTIAFWSLPTSAFTLSFYWLIRFLREQICVFASLGLIYLLSIHAPVISFRGGIPLINFILLFLMGLFVQPVDLGNFPLSWMGRLFSQLKKLIDRINSTPAWISRIAVAFLPILIVCMTIYWGLNASLADYRPYSYWNDETGYWVWVRSFSYVGLDTGYNAPNELIAPAAFNHYGEGSPFYIYLYGAIGQLFGWSPELPILVNFVILALAIFVFISFTKLQPTQIVMTGLITVLTWPIFLYLPMTTHETLNQAIGFILAIIFFRLLTHREAISLPLRISFVFLVYVAALLRLSWGLLLIPVIFYSLHGGVFRRILLSLLLGLGLYASVVLITSYLVPPTNNSIFLSLKDSLTRGPQVFTEHVVWQLNMIFRSGKMTPNTAIMFQILIIIAWNTIRLIRLIKSKLSVDLILQSQTVFNIYNVGSLALAGLLFYLQEGFYRTFTPAILIVYLLQITRKDYKLLAALLVINIAFLHSYLTYNGQISNYEIIKADFTSEFPQHDQLQTDMEKWIVFDPNVSTPWCNTLLIPQNYYDYRLTIIPPGIGISYILDSKTLETPLKSKYLLFDQEMYTILADDLNVELLDSSSIGDLYYNLDSDCDINQ